MYQALNIFFFAFHTTFIAFILTGWAWKKTRRLHLVCVLLTVFSWFVLGIWYGFGYCYCTDWHWRVRLHLGYDNMPASYIKFLIDSMTGWDVNAPWVDGITVSLFAIAAVISIWKNYADAKARAVASKSEARRP